jgi:hypothetical protein
LVEGEGGRQKNRVDQNGIGWDKWNVSFLRGSEIEKGKKGMIFNSVMNYIYDNTTLYFLCWLQNKDKRLIDKRIIADYCQI